MQRVAPLPPLVVTCLLLALLAGYSAGCSHRAQQPPAADSAPRMASRSMAWHSIDVNANVEEATQAVHSVFEELKLGDVQSRATAIDGWVKGRGADDSPVHIAISPLSDTTSRVTLTIWGAQNVQIRRIILERVQQRLAHREP